MKIKQFIEKIIQGGYKHPSYNLQKIVDDGMEGEPSLIRELVLIPEVWQAVGKVEGWKEHKIESSSNYNFISGWLHQMHRMIDALAEGKSLKSFIETL